MAADALVAPAVQPAGACIALEGVDITLGGNRIQREMSFTVGQGEFVAVLGPNGAGKSTLLKLLLGQVQPAAGTVSVLGRAPGRGNRAIGYVPQQRTIEAEGTMRTWDVVRLGLDGARWGPGLPSRDRTRRVNAALEEAAALHLASSPFGRLSGGERQRVLIAQALLCEPQLLLLDEPLASLDVTRAREMVALVRGICRSRGVTVLFVTHDINPLLADVDSVLYLANGRSAKGGPQEVITAGSLSRLYGSPVDVVRTSGRLFVVGAPI